MNRKAFTLTEMIISILLISILAFAVIYIFMEGFRSYIMNRNVIDLRGDVRPALKRMVFEIRESENIAQPLGNTAEFTIDADINDDGILESVRYYIDTDNLRRQVDGVPSPGNILLGNIDGSNTSFTALGTNSVILDITISKMDDAVHIRTQVRGRNI